MIQSAKQGQKLKTSWNRVVDFDQAAARHLGEKELTRFTWALDLVSAQIPKLQKNAQKRFSTIEIENCITKEADGKGAIVRDEGGRLQFTTEKLLLANDLKEEWAEQFNCELVPYFASVLPDGLRESELMAFVDFVISPEDAAKYRQQQEDKLFASEKKETANAENDQARSDAQRPGLQSRPEDGD